LRTLRSDRSGSPIAFSGGMQERRENKTHFA
jgi:hypothetical protein